MVGIPATGITYNRSPQCLLFNTTETITVSVLPVNATNPNVIWSTSNGAIATVDNGVITAQSTAGIVIITAAAGDGLGITVDFTPLAKEYEENTPGPAGGKLFYAKDSYSDGWRYLEVSNNPIGIKNAWNNGYYISIPGSYSHDFGAGKENTDAIIAAQGSGDYKAMDCHNFEMNGYTDWYMPSAGEANEIIIKIPDVNMTSYWGVASSSQDTVDFRGCSTYCDLNDGSVFKWNILPTGNSSADTWPVRRF
jgi:hypothetical protein